MRLASVSLLDLAQGATVGIPLVVTKEDGRFVAKLIDGTYLAELGSSKLMQSRFRKSTKDLFGVVTIHKKGPTALVVDFRT